MGKAPSRRVSGLPDTVASLPTNITTAKKSACKARKTFPEPEGGKSSPLTPSNRSLYLANRTNKTTEMPDSNTPPPHEFSCSATANEKVKMPHNKEIIVINQSGGLKDDIVSFPILFKDSSADCASAVVI